MADQGEERAKVTDEPVTAPGERGAAGSGTLCSAWAASACTCRRCWKGTRMPRPSASRPMCWPHSVRFIWNYIKYLPPKPLKFNKNGTLSKRQGDTDYPTAYRSIKAAGFDPKEERFAGLLKMLKSHRYQPDSMQLSPFFRRDTLEKSNDVIQQVVREAFHTTKRMHKYPFHKPHLVERVPDRSCSWMCSFKDLCTAELMGGNADNVRRLQFKKGDPMEYYYDQKEEEKDA